MPPSDEASESRFESSAELRFRAIIEAYDFAIIELDAKGRVVHADSSWVEMTGLGAGESSHERLRELIHPDDLSVFEEWAEILETRTSPYRLDFRMRKAEPSPAGAPGEGWRWLTLRGLLRLDEAGELLGAVSAVQDVSDYALARDGMIRAEQRWRSLWSHMPDNMSILDTRGTILEQNRTAFGLSEDRVVGANACDFMTARAQAEFRHALSEVLRTGDAFSYELQVDIDGEPSWWASKLIPIEERGDILQVIVINRDVTVERRSELDRIESARVAGRAEVATNVLHDIGNVINGVSTSAGLLGRNFQRTRLRTLHTALDLLELHRDDLAAFFAPGGRGEQLPELLRAVADELDREREEGRELLASLSARVDHIRAIVQAQQGFARSVGVVRRTTLVGLMEDALRICAAQRPWASGEIVRDFAEIPPLYLDKHRVLEILVNLIANARDAMEGLEAEARRMELRSRLSADGDRFILSVADNGAGIAAENLTRIFEHGFTTRENGGGFGLHASFNIAHELGGSLTVASEGPSRGAAFALELPLHLT